MRAGIPGQPGLYSKTLSQINNNKLPTHHHQDLGICDFCVRMGGWGFALCMKAWSISCRGLPSRASRYVDGVVDLGINYTPCPTVFPNPGPGPPGQGEMVRGTVLL